MYDLCMTNTEDVASNPFLSMFLAWSGGFKSGSRLS